MTSRSRVFALYARFALFAALALTAPSAEAAWPNDPAADYVALDPSFPGDGIFPASIPDGAGGAFISWFRYGPNNADIAVQHVSATGALLWGSSGVSVTNLPMDQYGQSMCSDGAGGVILSWIDQRNIGATSNDIYAQRINAAGTPVWTANGVAVCTFASPQWYPEMVGDGSGGAIITWRDDRAVLYDVYAQRVNAAGAPQWAANGVGICTAANDQYNPKIVADGSGGAIITWHDIRTPGNNSDIWAQRVNGAGIFQWATDGAPVCIAAGTQDNASIVADGTGGAIIAWRDYRNPSAPDIYAEHVNGAGTGQSAPGGYAICTANGAQIDPLLAPDGSRGAVIVWTDGRSGLDNDLYAQRFSGNGTAQWSANGVAVCTAARNQGAPSVASDGAGGAVIAWDDTRSVFAWDVYAQHMSGGGTPLWTANGAPISTIDGDQQVPRIVTDGAGGAIVAWQDLNVGFARVRANRIERFGYLGSPEPAIASVRDVPNDQGGKVKVSWYASYVDRASDPNLTAYDVYRSAPGSLALAAVRAGARRSTTFAQAPMPGERTFVFEPGTTQLYAWEYLGSVNAVHFLDTYGFVAETTGDSIGGSNPRTAIMVVGRNGNGSMYWLSAPDSGYSVDNLGPAAPAPFTGEYSAGSTALHWGANSEPDLSHYVLHRGTSPSFTPGLGNQVASLTETDYSDAAGQPYYYKLAALDMHGNRSGYTLLMPQGTADVGGTPAVLALALGPASPNPMRATATFRLALPRETRVTLAVFDERGRRVRGLLDGALPAGERSVRWDGRDESGHRVASGIYFCRLEADGRTLTRRFAALQ